MERSISLAILSLSGFLVLSPLVLKKPGWPAGLKADEPAYYLMALSLARDRDLRCELKDLRRLFDEFPYGTAENLILATDDGWNTVYYGKPYIYSLFAAPVAGWFGASGLLAFNFAMLAGMICLGSRYLQRFNAAPIAALFASGFFLVSAASAYVFWLQPEIFNMAAVTASLFLGLTEPSLNRGRFRRWQLLANPWIRAGGSGAMLALAAYNKPMLVLLGLPMLYSQLRQRRFRIMSAWILGLVVCLGAVMGLSKILIGHPSAYLGMTRGGHRVCSPHELPVQPQSPVPSDEGPAPADEQAATDQETAATDQETAATDQETASASPPAGSWYWMFRVPRLHPREVLENVGYFFLGRHTGLFLYFPFSLLALILFLVHGRGSVRRWAVLGSLAMVAAVFLLWIPANWQGGGGFVGNRYFVNAYPGFLFLVTRIAPSWLIVLGYSLGGVLLGPTLFTPMGRSIPWPTLQAHVRNFPFPLFPMELSLREVPGYIKQPMAGLEFRGRRDVFFPRGGTMWIHGATTVEIWIQSLKPVDRLLFHVGSLAAPNDVTLRAGRAEQRLHFAPGEAAGTRPVELRPGKPTRVRSVQGTPVYAYRLAVTSATGEVRAWTKRYPPLNCSYFPERSPVEDTFYVGAELLFLGPRERVERDLYAVEWGECRAPSRVMAGEVFSVDTRVKNISQESWPADPPTRVGLSYRWENVDGEAVGAEGPRTHPEAVVEPGTLLAIPQQVQAPAQPGSYFLVLDLVYELVAWFSDQNGGNVYRFAVEVVADDSADGAGDPESADSPAALLRQPESP